MKNMKRLVPVFLLLFLMSAPVYADDFQDGLDAFYQGEYEQALEKWQPLAELGDVLAQFSIATLYENGQGVTQNYQEAVKWYRQSAEQGFVGAQFNLGGMFAEGKGITQNYQEAVKWYKLSAEQGNAEAKTKLKIIAKDKGVKQDAREATAQKLAKKWIEKHGGVGKKTEFSIGFQVVVFIITGLVVYLFFWLYRPSFDSGKRAIGFSTSSFQDGVEAYNMGDYETALKKFKLLAEKGSAGAQYNLGRMYEMGEGVVQDQKEAVKWYELSAEQGDTEAQSNLGTMYGNGQGVAQDFVLAHMWFNLACLQGNEDVMQNRTMVESQMNPDKIAEAQKLAREWIVMHGKK